MRFLITFLALSFPVLGLWAQKEYSYFNDRFFTAPEQIYGSTFIPFKGKLTNAHFDDPIKLGLVKFEMTSSVATITERVTFTTGGIKGENKSEPFKMSISSINRTGWGYDLVLMDIQNPNVQGYLKVYINQGNVTKLLFRPELSASERTFYLPPPPDYVEARDGKFFTHEQDIDLKDFSSLLDQTIYPFFKLQDRGDYQEFSRIYPDDRLVFKIEERMILKGKKEKPFRYIVFNDGNNSSTPKVEYLIKKTKDVRLSDRFMKRDRDAVEVLVEDETTKEEIKIYFYRNQQKKLEGIRMGEVEFGMRKGKRNDK